MALAAPIPRPVRPDRPLPDYLAAGRDWYYNSHTFCGCKWRLDVGSVDSITRVEGAVLDLPDWLPIFPLPNCVLLPQSILPLHVFEDRYRAMTRDVLAGNRLLALAQLKPCTQEQYLTLHAPIHPAVGVGRVVKVDALPDGRFNFLLQGLERVEVQTEDASGPYRRARCRLIRARDLEPSQECRILRELRQQFTSPILRAFPPLAKVSSILDCCTYRLADKLDAVASVVLTATAEKQQLLAMPCLAGRAEMVFNALNRLELAVREQMKCQAVEESRRRDCLN